MVVYFNCPGGTMSMYGPREQVEARIAMLEPHLPPGTKTNRRKAQPGRRY